MSSEQKPKIRTVKVAARGQGYRVVQVAGNLFVCSRENGSCCCSWEEKGRLPIANSVWSDEWERRGIRHRLHLTFSGCLGPCIAGNNALLQVLGASVWFSDLNNAALIPMVFGYAEAILDSGAIVPPPAELAGHVYDRYPGPDEDPGGKDEADGLERLDPVCLMDVDPTTAKYSADHNGRRVYFCAPSCRKQFMSNPEAFELLLPG
ncbi:MAG: hypothetical protein ABI577_04290 [bacterium]